MSSCLGTLNPSTLKDAVIVGKRLEHELHRIDVATNDVLEDGRTKSRDKNGAIFISGHRNVGLSGVDVPEHQRRTLNIGVLEEQVNLAEERLLPCRQLHLGLFPSVGVPPLFRILYLVELHVGDDDKVLRTVFRPGVLCKGDVELEHPLDVGVQATMPFHLHETFIEGVLRIQLEALRMLGEGDHAVLERTLGLLGKVHCKRSGDKDGCRLGRAVSHASAAIGAIHGARHVCNHKGGRVVGPVRKSLPQLLDDDISSILITFLADEIIRHQGAGVDLFLSLGDVLYECSISLAIVLPEGLTILESGARGKLGVFHFIPSVLRDLLLHDIDVLAERNDQLASIPVGATAGFRNASGMADGLWIVPVVGQREPLGQKGNALSLFHEIPVFLDLILDHLAGHVKPFRLCVVHDGKEVGPAAILSNLLEEGLDHFLIINLIQKKLEAPHEGRAFTHAVPHVAQKEEVLDCKRKVLIESLDIQLLNS